MTYLEFHLIFLLPPIAAMLYMGKRRKGYFSAKRIWSLLIIICIAFAYTTPWDNLLVKTGVWGYGIDRVLGTWGYVPVEEYMFFILQPILTGLFLYHILKTNTEAKGDDVINSYAGTAHWVGTLSYTYLSLLGMLLLQYSDQYYYLALILVWACPILAFQWAFGGNYLWKNRSIFFIAVSIPTVYLWIADRIAIELGIWYISSTYTTGAHVFGLPIEEATFFLVTNLLVTQGVMLSVYKWDAFAAYFNSKRVVMLRSRAEKL